MTQHLSHLRPVARDSSDEWRVLPLLREVWDTFGGLVPEAWMLWCATCRTVVEGTAMADTADRDIDDLLGRRAEFDKWQAKCQAAHQANPASHRV